MINIKNSVMVNRPIDEVSEQITMLSRRLTCSIEGKHGEAREFSYSCNDGLMPERGDFLLEPDGNATRVTFLLALEIGRFLGLLKSIIMPIARWEIKRSMDRLKNEIESGA